MWGDSHCRIKWFTNSAMFASPTIFPKIQTKGSGLKNEENEGHALGVTVEL